MKKAMALDPARPVRFRHGLGQEVDHWLADEPVRAHREPAAQRARGGQDATSRPWRRSPCCLHRRSLPSL